MTRIIGRDNLLVLNESRTKGNRKGKRNARAREVWLEYILGKSTRGSVPFFTWRTGKAHASASTKRRPGDWTISSRMKLCLVNLQLSVTVAIVLPLYSFAKFRTMLYPAIHAICICGSDRQDVIRAVVGLVEYGVRYPSTKRMVRGNVNCSQVSYFSPN